MAEPYIDAQSLRRLLQPADYIAMSQRHLERYVESIWLALDMPAVALDQVFAQPSFAFGAQVRSMIVDVLADDSGGVDAVGEYIMACFYNALVSYHEGTVRYTTEEMATLRNRAVSQLDGGVAPSDAESAVDVEAGDVGSSVSGNEAVPQHDDPAPHDDAHDVRADAHSGVVGDTDVVDTDSDARAGIDTDTGTVTDTDTAASDVGVDPAHDRGRVYAAGLATSGPTQGKRKRFVSSAHVTPDGKFAPYEIDILDDNGEPVPWDELDPGDQMAVHTDARDRATATRNIANVNKPIADQALAIVTERMQARGWTYSGGVPLKALVDAFFVLVVMEEHGLDDIELSQDEINLIAVLADYRPHFDRLATQIEQLDAKLDRVMDADANIRASMRASDNETIALMHLLGILISDRLNLNLVPRSMDVGDFSIQVDALMHFIDDVRDQAAVLGQQRAYRKGRDVGGNKGR